MNKVRFETSGALGFLTLANPPLNLFDEELIEDLRTAVNQARQAPIRALLVRAVGKVFSAGADVSIFKGRTAIEARDRFTQAFANDRGYRRASISHCRGCTGALYRGRDGADARMRSGMGGRVGTLQPS